MDKGEIHVAAFIPQNGRAFIRSQSREMSATGQVIWKWILFTVLAFELGNVQQRQVDIAHWHIRGCSCEIVLGYLVHIMSQLIVLLEPSPQSLQYSDECVVWWLALSPCSIKVLDWNPGLDGPTNNGLSVWS